MNTIVCIATKKVWDKSQKLGQYTQSTIDSTLDEIGFIHATSPNQTMDVVQRFVDNDDVLLLLIDMKKVKPPVRLEAARSGRAGLFPHIYGALNIDAVYAVVEVDRNVDNEFIAPDALLKAVG